MKAALAAVLAGAAAPVFAAPQAPYSYGRGNSTTASRTTLYSTGVTSSSVASPTSTGSSWPECWGYCFSKYGVTSEGGLCSQPLSGEVSSCVQSECTECGDVGAIKQYEWWLQSYCSGSTTVTDMTTDYTTICPVTETQTWGGQTTTSVWTTTSVVTPYQSGWPTWTSTPTPTPTVPTSICTETSTQIWRGTTIYSTYVVTHTLTVNSVTETETPSTWGPSPSEYTTTTVQWGGIWTTTQTWAPETVVQPTGWGSQPGQEWTTITQTRSIYTTVCPVTETWVSSGITSVISYITTQTVPVKTTQTLPPYQWSSSQSSGIWTSGTGVSSSPSGTGVSSRPSSTGVSSRPSGTVISSYPSSTGGSSPYGGKCVDKPKKQEKCVPCQGQPGSDPDTFCGLTINSNYYSETPITCRTVTYDFTITNGTVSPDGVPRMGLLVNGQFPGPAITANWGDTVVIHVHNSLPADGQNGTTVHWHGVRQVNSTAQDGVPSIVQCPIAPGHSQTYTWVASNYGTTWYHSHFALQTWEGLFGPIIINGPAAQTYDDEETIILQDWSHATADELYDSAQFVSENTNRTNPVMDLGLINGMNVYTPPGPPGAAPTTGKRFQLDVTAGKSYRLRIINAAIAAVFIFYVDQHELTVIAADFVPVEPFTVTTLPVNIGQRYDVILTANQAVGNYWMRSDNQQPCSPMIAWNNTNAIVHYAGASSDEPTSQAYGYEPSCSDIEYGLLKPVLSQSATSQSQLINETALIGVDPANTQLFKWTLSGTTFQSQWGDPTLLSILENGTIPSYSGNLAISAPTLGQWIYVIIDSPIPVAHPIHLHGHDFLILAQGSGNYDSSVPLNLDNPPRRDTAMMNADPLQGEGSYLVVAFYTNNPGVWLMHCHIGWIIEAQDQIKSTVDNECAIKDTCAAWDAYSSQYGLVVPDSGI